jgi:tape measure domain-containing protein
MANEVISISIIETGSRTVKRNLDAIGAAADKATRSLYLIQRALFVLGAGGLVRGLVGLLNTLTEYENRLRLTSASAANMQGVQNALFEVAIRSRTEFAAVADVYSRTALSAKNLGLSQQSLLDITESLSKAAIISGANSREANAALVQLSQGIASNRLGGDELRSILEQLPYVADVIANYMTSTGKFGQVGRGELRKLGAQGKITAQIVVDSFKASKTSIDAAFSNTTPTIEQAATNVQTAFLKFLDTMDDTYQISQKIAAAIQFVADNIATLTTALATATGAVIAYYAAYKINTLEQAIVSTMNYYSAIKNGTYAVAGSIQAELARTEALVAMRGAEAASASAAVVAAQSRVGLLRISQAQAAQTVLDTEFTVANGKARSVLTGRFIEASGAATRYNTALGALNITTNSLTASEARLAEATAVAAGAQQAAAAATAEQAVATAAASTWWGRLSLAMPGLAALLTKVGRLFTGLGAAIAKNPITAFIVALITATALLLGFGDKIHPVANKLVNLQDIAYVVFADIMKFVQPVFDFFAFTFGKAIDVAISAVDFFNQAFLTGIQALFLSVIGIISLTVGNLVGVAAGVYGAFMAAWGQFPAAFEALFVLAVNGAIAAINSLISTAVAPLKDLIGLIDIVGKTNYSATLTAFTTIPSVTASVAGQKAGADMAQGFADGFKKGKGVVDNALAAVVQAPANIVNSIVADATKRAQDRAADQALIAKAQALLAGGTKTPTTPTTGGGGKNKKDFQSYLNDMLKEIEVSKRYGVQKEILSNIEKAEEKIKRSLTDAEKDQIATATRALEIAKQEGDILQSLRGPQEEYATRIAAINDLMAQGTITAQEYAKAMIQANSNSNPTGFGSGVMQGLNQVSAKMYDIGNLTSDWVVQSFGAASDAIVEFAKTGELNVKQLFQDIFANLLKLATDQIFSMIIGGLLTGGVGAGFGGGFSLLSLLGLASGGSIMPSGTGSTDSQVVMFNKRPDERVDVLTPSQQKAQAAAFGGGGGAGAGGGTQVSVPVQIVNVDDPAMVPTAMQSAAGSKAIMNVIRKNPEAIKALLR